MVLLVNVVMGIREGVCNGGRRGEILVIVKVR